MRVLWVSCKWATGMVKVGDDGIVTDTPPVWRKFIGQPLDNLLKWLKADRVRDLQVL